MFNPRTTIAAGLLLAAAGSNALQLDVNSASSIKSAAKVIAADVASIYDAGLKTSRIPGNLPTPYYWWEAGLMFDSLINYWALTGDSSYNALVSEGMLWQSEPNGSYMPPNQTSSEGNDDQSIWALAAMTAAENNFPAPANSSGAKSWVQMAETVFNLQVERWDASSCGGGLRWQVFPFNDGYNYKNAASNGQFLQLAARLARFTGNSTYSEWASKMAAWSTSVPIVTSDYQVNDGITTTGSGACKNPNAEQFTLNYAAYLAGYAYMANYTSSQNWTTAVPKFWSRIDSTFFKNGILTEVICQASNNCDTDDLAFRATMGRALASTAYLVPSLNATITKVILTSAQGAAGQCSGGPNATQCGVNWSSTTYDGTTGLGQELSALEIILAALPLAASGANSASTTTGKPSSTGTASGSFSTGAPTGTATTTSSVTGTSSTTSSTASATSNAAAGEVGISALGGLAAVGFAMAALA